MVPFNFHTHSNFSDGACQPEEYVIEAIRQHFKGLGFSEHSVLPFDNTFALKNETEAEYCQEISRLKEKYKKELNIYCSLEVDYVPMSTVQMASLQKKLDLDYLIGSVHLVRESDTDDLWFIDGPLMQTYDDGLKNVFKGDVKRAISAYWGQVQKMVAEEKFDVIGHLDKIKMHNKGRWFNEEDEWYITLVNDTIDLIAERKLLVEINTRGLYKKRSDTFFPNDYIINRLFQKGIGVVISSDAHKPEEISLYFAEAAEKLRQTGYSSSFIFEAGKWKEVSLIE